MRRSEVLSLCRGRSACVAETATSVREDLQVFIYPLTLVFGNAGFVLACDFFPFKCSVESVANVPVWHRSDPRWKINSDSSFYLSFYFSFLSF